MAGIGHDVLGIGVAYRLGEHHGTHRLLLAAAIGAGDTGDRHGDVGMGTGEGALRHAPGDGDRDRAESLQHVAADLEHVVLGLVRIGDEAGIEDVGRSGDLGERGGDKAPGAALGDGHPATGSAIGFKHLACGGDQLRRENRVHRAGHVPP